MKFEPIKPGGKGTSEAICTRATGDIWNKREHYKYHMAVSQGSILVSTDFFLTASFFLGGVVGLVGPT